ncbi:uncharacterized protein LOC114460574 isoform X2 [Gouania willdenowi]|uniref:uncharacterized protein LOC114460574 isoform X2 n=1 Tax=Gouania willdenowi TaxID=441366 RepID=UPI0010553EFD|nr:uncharacterized protein LOC114460574 isoform X2 [Gouania willdenowi]
MKTVCFQLLVIYGTFVFSDQRIISVEPGGDVTLPCEVPDGETNIVVEWRRSGRKDGYVLLYKDQLFDPEYQLQSYRDRVHLQIENRTISLILKNVTPDDEGTYECRIFRRNSSRQQRSVIGSVIGGNASCSISLRVGPSAMDAFLHDKVTKEPGVVKNITSASMSDHLHPPDAQHRNRYGIIASGVLVFIVVVVIYYRNHWKDFRRNRRQLRAVELEEVVHHPDPDVDPDVDLEEGAKLRSHPNLRAIPNRPPHT